MCLGWNSTYLICKKKGEKKKINKSASHGWKQQRVGKTKGRKWRSRRVIKQKWLRPHSRVPRGKHSTVDASPLSLAPTFALVVFAHGWWATAKEGLLSHLSCSYNNKATSHLSFEKKLIYLKKKKREEREGVREKRRRGNQQGEARIAYQSS